MRDQKAHNREHNRGNGDQQQVSFIPAKVWTLIDFLIGIFMNPVNLFCGIYQATWVAVQNGKSFNQDSNQTGVTGMMPWTRTLLVAVFLSITAGFLLLHRTLQAARASTQSAYSWIQTFVMSGGRCLKMSVVLLIPNLLLADPVFVSEVKLYWGPYGGPSPVTVEIIDDGHIPGHSNYVSYTWYGEWIDEDWDHQNGSDYIVYDGPKTFYGSELCNLYYDGWYFYNTVEIGYTSNLKDHNGIYYWEKNRTDVWFSSGPGHSPDDSDDLGETVYISEIISFYESEDASDYDDPDSWGRHHRVGRFVKYYERPLIFEETRYCPNPEETR